jgi:hypothetical protein
VWEVGVPNARRVGWQPKRIGRSHRRHTIAADAMGEIRNEQIEDEILSIR